MEDCPAPDLREQPGSQELQAGALPEVTVRVFPLTEKLKGARLVKSEALRVTLELVFVRSMLQLPPQAVMALAISACCLLLRAWKNRFIMGSFLFWA